jgi:hypothetical protein
MAETHLGTIRTSMNFLLLTWGRHFSIVAMTAFSLRLGIGGCGLGRGHGPERPGRRSRGIGSSGQHSDFRCAANSAWICNWIWEWVKIEDHGTTDFSLFLVLTCINHLTIGVPNFDSYPIVRIFFLQSFRPLASLAIAKASSRDNFLEVIALRHVFFGKKVLRSSRIPSFSRLHTAHFPSSRGRFTPHIRPPHGHTQT